MIHVLPSCAQDLQHGSKCEDMSSRPNADSSVVISALCMFPYSATNSTLKSHVTSSSDPWGRWLMDMTVCSSLPRKVASCRGLPWMLLTGTICKSLCIWTPISYPLFYIAVYFLLLICRIQKEAHHLSCLEIVSGGLQVLLF